MIHLDRDAREKPSIFDSTEMHAEQERLTRFYAEPFDLRRQRSYKINPRLIKQCENAAYALSSDKCAYCETKRSPTSGRNIEWYRPKGGAVGLDGKMSPDHYWWLTYEWSNLVPACTECCHLKGSRFPVEGERSPIGAIGDSLAAERPLLLNPFEDQPAQHLVFSEDGLVVGKTERGRISVEVFGLNRESLVAYRKDWLAIFRENFETLALAKKFGQSALQDLLSDSLPFVAACRQFAGEWLEDIVPKSQDKRRKKLSEVLPKSEARVPTSPAERELQVANFRAEQSRQESFSVASDDTKRDYFIKTRYIERIEIENFKPIERLVLRFPNQSTLPAALPASLDADPQSAPRTPWLMLLGENSSGKSSVLQAVALCLLGNEWRTRVGLDARTFLRDGAERGFVRVSLTGSRTPIELNFSEQSAHFLSSPGEPKMLLLGYGSTRLLPRPGVMVEGHHSFAQTDNLFNPFVALGDATAWLTSLDQTAFDNVARALKTLLLLGDEDKLVRTLGPDGRLTVVADLMGVNTPLGELSDGYQSVLALTCDIMRVLLSRWETMEIAEGLVLLDEIGSHLHPRWRMRIVQSMRDIFPRVQFLVSTHDPLCLRGLDDGEITVMRRDRKHGVTAISEGLPPIRGLRVDQLLTSEFFGLNGTIDPELETLFEEYYGLLALPVPTAIQELRIIALRESLDKYRVLGNNRRERLMLEIIDEFLAREPDIPDDEFRGRLSENTKQRIRQAWEGKKQIDGVQWATEAIAPVRTQDLGEPA